MTYKPIKYEELEDGYIKIKKEELDKILSEEYLKGYSCGSMNGCPYRYDCGTKDYPIIKNVPYTTTTTGAVIC